jgi:hypothetical protein
VEEGVTLAGANEPHPATPDGRYFVVRGRLWRLSDPRLSTAERSHWVDRLMAARRAVGVAKMAGETLAIRKARSDVDAAKRALGERGPVWWDDGAPDYNRRMAASTPYAEWYRTVALSQREIGSEI